jgi:glutamate synthase domain-containing protein 2
MCPTNALTIKPHDFGYRPNANWTRKHILDLNKQAETGGVILTGSGNDKPFRIYWDHLVLNASQVTNPSIDPLREPMELRTYLGRKPENVEYEDGEVKAKMAPQVMIETPIIFSALSYGAISYQAWKSLLMAAEQSGTLCNTGEGGWPQELRTEHTRVIAQCASGRFGVHSDYLNAGAAVEIKVGQGLLATRAELPPVARLDKQAVAPTPSHARKSASCYGIRI